MAELKTYLEAHRCGKGDTEWNLTGLTSGRDMGKYKAEETSVEAYDAFLRKVHTHIFGVHPQASSLLERHREQGPILIDLDFRYDHGGPLTRRFNTTQIQRFIAEYAATMIYFSRLESLTTDLDFYHLEKPGAETASGQHKDGIHIQCPQLSTPPKYQFGIRGHMLVGGSINRVFGSTDFVNPAEDCFDVSVIQRNNWFLYGACKPDKAQYRVANVFRLCVGDVRDFLDGGDPDSYEELVDIVYEHLTPVETAAKAPSYEIMKTLSIRRNHKTVVVPEIRSIRTKEWDELMSVWGSGKAKPEKASGVRIPENTFVGDEGDEGQLVVSTVESVRVTDLTTPDDIALAYRLCKECISAERRAAEYHDWIRLAICLKNIANTEESYNAWVDVTRRVDDIHKKRTLTDAQLRDKWRLVRVDASHKIGIASLQHWAEEDNPETLRRIRSETHTKWILNYGKDTHVSVASFVCRLYKTEFRSTIGAGRAAKWYQYMKGKHGWKFLRTSTEVRSRLSDGVRQEYWKAERNVKDKKYEMKPDEALEAQSDAQDTAVDSQIKKLAAIQRNLETTTFKDHVLKECTEKFFDDEFESKLNMNKDLVGCANGVLELRHCDSEDGVGRPRVLFRDGLPEDNISFMMGHCDNLEPLAYEPYDPTNPTSQHLEILAFFERIYPDAVLREYVMTLYASCLEGINREQRFYVNQGVGSNGKSMIEVLMEKTFGDYCASMQTTVFTRKRPDSSSANPDIIGVKGCRYIHMGEPDDNEKINTSIMKQFTGGDAVNARGLFADQEKFVIMGKIFMSCNDLPPINKVDNGTWRRVRVIPHNSIFKDPGDPSIEPSKHIYEKDLNLEGKLVKWRGAYFGILVWYFENHYLVHGLKEPACVLAASNKYKEENDAFMLFFTETYVKDTVATPVTAKDVRAHFNNWKKTQPKTLELKVGTVLERMKVECGNNSTETQFWGIRLGEYEDCSGAQLTNNMP